MRKENLFIRHRGGTMSKTVFYLVTDNSVMIDKAKSFWQDNDVQVQVYSPQQWKVGLENPQFREQLSTQLPSLSMGTPQILPVTNSLPMHDGNNLIQFPTATVKLSVQKMEQMEAQAIENAIQQYKGNLTEAAKALGIGRATLYRKVKQYKIDPSASRKRKVKVIAA